MGLTTSNVISSFDPTFFGLKSFITGNGTILIFALPVP
jgi:hypothetical protein